MSKLTDEQIDAIAFQVVEDGIPGRGHFYEWCVEVGRPFARAIESAGVQPPDGTTERDWKLAVMLAYGHLWHINNEPAAPIALYGPERAAYQARRHLRDLLTTQERGEAINQVGFLIDRYEATSEAVCAEPVAEAPEPDEQKTPSSSIQAESPSADRDASEDLSRASGEAVQRPDGSAESLPFTDDPVEVARRVDALRTALVDKNIEEGKMPRMVWEAQAALSNPCTQVYFRAGLLACREYMARFVEAESPSIAASIRANWWPQLGEDPGPPRLLDWNEVADGGEDGPWTAKAISPQREALPTALQFLESMGAAVHQKASEPNDPEHSTSIQGGAKP